MDRAYESTGSLSCFGGSTRKTRVSFSMYNILPRMQNNRFLTPIIGKTPTLKRPLDIANPLENPPKKARAEETQVHSEPGPLVENTSSPTTSSFFSSPPSLPKSPITNLGKFQYQVPSPTRPSLPPQKTQPQQIQSKPQAHISFVSPLKQNQVDKKEATVTSQGIFF